MVHDGSGWRRLVSTKGHGCTFLTREGGCGVYEARPVQCRAYPFWPRVLKSPETWNHEVGGALQALL